MASLNLSQGNARCCSIRLASKPKLAATMNMEEYAYERGPKSTRDISSCSKGSSYEVEEDEERYASSEEQVAPLTSLAIKVLKRSNPTSTPSSKAWAKVFTIIECSNFLFEISLLFNEFFSCMPTLNLPMQQDIEHLR